MAHPRSRGENIITDANPLSRHGSSPLTRGKRGHGSHGQVEHGLIPAHAGKTRRILTEADATKAHPRSRGENTQTSYIGMFKCGSSPLTRGKHADLIHRDVQVRLIPAHAGKTPCAATHDLLTGGSSPLTRGKLPQGSGRYSQPGLIPAHAGKTSGDPHLHGDRGAHPRSRGENQPRAIVSTNHDGSSPLTRGKLFCHFHDQETAGLIPAHAGKTVGSLGIVQDNPAHPRSRGENNRGAHMATAATGSSPLTRGKRSRAWSPTPTPGLIPAHAGKTIGPY